MHYAIRRLFGGLVALLLFTVASPALAADTTRPTVGPASPDTATVGTAVTISASADDASGIASCNLYVDNEDVGSMSISFGTAQISYVFGQAGVHSMFVFCRDTANNFNSGPNSSISVNAAPSYGGGGPALPTVGQPSPLAATVGTAVMMSVDVTGAASCLLYVNSFSQGSMTLNSGIASRAHTFETAGSPSVYAQCFNSAGNSTSGATATVTVTEKVAIPTELRKAVCPSGATSDHPCKAVYYRSTDGKRHAFPNAKVFFTWYADFSTVKDVSTEELSASPLGKQVTYRPGFKLVKFTTVNKVYAVAKGGTLRWVKTEAVAVALYGADWNTKVDDISDAFYVNYTFGADISNAGEYSPSAEMAATTTIDQNF